MKFSREYRKLQDRLFTTIRKEDHYQVGQRLPCETPITAFTARVLFKATMPFEEIPVELLQYDIEAPGQSKAVCMERIRALYRYSAPPRSSDWVTIYLLERLPEGK